MGLRLAACESQEVGFTQHYTQYIQFLFVNSETACSLSFSFLLYAMFLPLLRIQRKNKGNQPELLSVEGGCVAVKWTMHTNYPEASQRLFLSFLRQKSKFWTPENSEAPSRSFVINNGGERSELMHQNSEEGRVIHKTCFSGVSDGPE